MTLIIAEAGVNHNGDAGLAFKLVDAAYNAGADIVKFQTFKASKLASGSAAQAEYQIANIKKQESQIDMLARLELPYSVYRELMEYCNSLGIEFLSTAFDSQSLHFLVHEVGLKRLKIPSGDITNAPLVLQHAQTGGDIILSTGMASLADIERCLGVIAYGYLYPHVNKPSGLFFREAYASEEGQSLLKNKVTLLHCTTEYPAPLDEINLRVMETFMTAFALKTGYSDHSVGITVPIAAVARGAEMLEKHFTLDKNMAGPDHKASLDPDELRMMVKAVRDVEIALGSSIKAPSVSEIKNMPIARKSLVANVDISEGEVFTEENLTIKRPGLGVSPYDYWDMLGRKASKTYKKDELI